MFNLLTEAAEAGGSGFGGISFMLIYVVLIGGFIYIMGRKRRKEEKRMRALIESLEVGDVVVTTSGFYGVVIAVQDDDCIVEFGNNRNCRVPMRKSAIVEVEKSTQEEAESKE